MSEATSLSSLIKHQAALGWMLLVMWLVYLATLFPILDEHLVLSLLTLSITMVGLVGAVLALRGHKLWIGVSSAAATLLIIRYIIYWQGIRENISADSPQMSVFEVMGEITKSGMLIFEHKLSQGEVLGAVLTMVNEFAMPALEIGFLIVAGVLLLVNRQRGSQPSKL